MHCIVQYWRICRIYTNLKIPVCKSKCINNIALFEITKSTYRQTSNLAWIIIRICQRYIRRQTSNKYPCIISSLHTSGNIVVGHIVSPTLCSDNSANIVRSAYCSTKITISSRTPFPDDTADRAIVAYNPARKSTICYIAATSANTASSTSPGYCRIWKAIFCISLSNNTSSKLPNINI